MIHMKKNAIGMGFVWLNLYPIYRKEAFVRQCYKMYHDEVETGLKRVYSIKNHSLELLSYSLPVCKSATLQMHLGLTSSVKILLTFQ